jgi:hypothetical protein
VVKMKKYFAPDLQFVPYNQANGKPLTREGLLMTMVHPGLHERLTPRDYVIDLKQKIVVAQFEVQFSDQPSGKVWPPKQASAHYFLDVGEDDQIKINKIVYFMEQRPPEESSFRPLWAEYRDREIKENKALLAKLK